MMEPIELVYKPSMKCVYARRVNGHLLPRVNAAGPIRAGSALVRAHPPAIEVEHDLAAARLPQPQWRS